MKLNSTLNETECESTEDCKGDCACVSKIGVCLDEKLVAESLFKCSCASDEDCISTDKCDLVTKKCWQCQSEAVSSAVNSCGLLTSANKNSSKPHYPSVTPSESSSIWLPKESAMDFRKATFALAIVLFMIFVRISIVRRRSIPK